MMQWSTFSKALWESCQLRDEQKSDFAPPQQAETALTVLSQRSAISALLIYTLSNISFSFWMKKRDLWQQDHSHSHIHFLVFPFSWVLLLWVTGKHKEQGPWHFWLLLTWHSSYRDRKLPWFTFGEQSLAFTERFSVPFSPCKSLPLKGQHHFIPTSLPVCTMFTATASLSNSPSQWQGVNAGVKPTLMGTEPHWGYLRIHSILAGIKQHPIRRLRVSISCWEQEPQGWELNCLFISRVEKCYVSTHSDTDFNMAWQLKSDRLTPGSPPSVNSNWAPHQRTILTVQCSQQAQTTNKGLLEGSKRGQKSLRCGPTCNSGSHILARS